MMRSSPLRFSALLSFTLLCASLRSLRSSAPLDAALCYTAFLFAPLRFASLLYAILHYTALLYVILRYAALLYDTLRFFTLKIALQTRWK